MKTALLVAFVQQQIMKDQLFEYIESEMLACESDMLDPVVGFNDNYGHANKAALWAALSRLYLNADTYVGVNKYTECVTYSKKIISAGYQWNRFMAICSKLIMTNPKR